MTLHVILLVFGCHASLVSSSLQATQLFGLVVDVWSNRLDSVSNVQYRKLTGLAIANLLPVVDS